MTANIDGLESAVKKGFFEIPYVVAADVLCIQETKCPSVEDIIKRFSLDYHVIASNRGLKPDGKPYHGGVAILSRFPITNGITSESTVLEPRGQFVAGTICSISVASIYVTLNNTLTERTTLSKLFDAVSQQSENALLCGDFNTFRKPQDSHRWHIAKNAYEYGTDYYAVEWMNSLIKDGRWVDAIGSDCKTRPLYTWWSTQALFIENRGTRLDHQLVSPPLLQRLVPGSVTIHKDFRRGKHAQVSAEYDVSLERFLNVETRHLT